MERGIATRRTSCSFVRAFVHSVFWWTRAQCLCLCFLSQPFVPDVVLGACFFHQAMFDPAQRQVEELVAAEKEVEESLIRDAQGAGSDFAGGLAEQETKDVWKMLQADKERILTLSRRLAAARERLRELGVKRE